MSISSVEFVIMDVTESHDTSVISLCCSSLADHSDTTGYRFLTSVIKTRLGRRYKAPHMFLASVLQLRSQLKQNQKVLVHMVMHDRAADCTHGWWKQPHICALWYMAYHSQTLLWLDHTQSNRTDFWQESLYSGLPQCAVLNSISYDGVRHDFSKSHKNP